MKKNTTAGLAIPHPSIKLKNYNFEKKLKPRLESAKSSNKNYHSAHRSVTLDVGRTLSPNKSSTWRPKIPSKKLFEDPQFMQSIERKQTKVINRMCETNITISDSSMNNFYHESLQKRSKSIPLKQRRISDFSSEKYTHNDIGNF